MKLPEGKRSHFKDSKGELFKNTEKALEHLESISYEQIITVGDVASVEFLSNGIEPDIVIVDFSVMRSPLEKEKEEIIEDYDVKEVDVENQAGYITDEMWEIIENAEPPVKIIVDGEEDLATVPAVLNAPIGSIVVYGQPGKGIVIIEVSEKKKEEFKELLDLFEEEE